MSYEIHDLVWSKLEGYPFWPSFISPEPDTGLVSKGSELKLAYHVTFLAENSHAWVPASCVRTFLAEDTGPDRSSDYRCSKKWETDHTRAMKLGLDLLLEKAGVVKTFQGQLVDREESLDEESTSEVEYEVATQKEGREDDIPAISGIESPSSSNEQSNSEIEKESPSKDESNSTKGKSPNVCGNREEFNLIPESKKSSKTVESHSNPKGQKGASKILSKSKFSQKSSTSDFPEEIYGIRKLEVKNVDLNSKEGKDIRIWEEKSGDNPKSDQKSKINSKIYCKIEPSSSLFLAKESDHEIKKNKHHHIKKKLKSPMSQPVIVDRAKDDKIGVKSNIKDPEIGPIKLSKAEAFISEIMENKYDDIKKRRHKSHHSKKSKGVNDVKTEELHNIKTSKTQSKNEPKKVSESEEFIGEIMENKYDIIKKRKLKSHQSEAVHCEAKDSIKGEKRKRSSHHEEESLRSKSKKQKNSRENVDEFPTPDKPIGVEPSTGVSSACGECRPCLASNCGSCHFCLDSPTFGGPGLLTSLVICSQRICQRQGEILLGKPKSEIQIGKKKESWHFKKEESKTATYDKKKVLKAKKDSSDDNNNDYVASEKVPPPKVKRLGTKGCGCDGCLKQNCGQCIYCLDMPAFGGLGKKRQRCKERQCEFKGIVVKRKRKEAGGDGDGIKSGKSRSATRAVGRNRQLKDESSSTDFPTSSTISYEKVKENYVEKSKKRPKPTKIPQNPLSHLSSGESSDFSDLEDLNGSSSSKDKKNRRSVKKALSSGKEKKNSDAKSIPAYAVPPRCNPPYAESGEEGLSLNASENDDSDLETPLGNYKIPKTKTNVTSPARDSGIAEESKEDETTVSVEISKEEKVKEDAINEPSTSVLNSNEESNETSKTEMIENIPKEIVSDSEEEAKTEQTEASGLSLIQEYDDESESSDSGSNSNSSSEDETEVTAKEDTSKPPICPDLEETLQDVEDKKVDPITKPPEIKNSPKKKKKSRWDVPPEDSTLNKETNKSEDILVTDIPPTDEIDEKTLSTIDKDENMKVSKPEEKPSSEHYKILKVNKSEDKSCSLKGKNGSNIDVGGKLKSCGNNPGQRYKYQYGPLPQYDVTAKVLNSLPRKNIFDSHCRLDSLFNRLNQPDKIGQGYLNFQLQKFSEFQAAFPREIPQRFEGCITNLCDPKLWNVIGTPVLLNYLEKEPGIYYTLGCHPHHAEKMLGSSCMKALERLLKWGKGGRCVALGECGLDLSTNKTNWTNPSLEVQKKAFKFQLELAMKLNLPLVLHIREAEQHAMDVMRKAGVPPDYPMHRHCFNDTWQACQDWMNRFPRSFIGLTNLVTYHSARNIHEIASLIPLGRLILETGAPHFPPRQNFPGQVCHSVDVLPDDPSQGSYNHEINPNFPVEMSHPGHVIHAAAQVAELRDMSLEDVLTNNRKNVAKLYRIKEKRISKE